MVAVWRRYKGLQFEIILEANRGWWRCHEVRVSHDPHRQTPMSLPVRGTFIDVMGAIRAGEARAQAWIDEYRATSKGQ
jgi:hypothetical protein